MFASLARPRGLQRTILWSVPLVAAVVFVAAGYFVRMAVEHRMQSHLRSVLTAMLDADVSALEIWVDEQKANVDTLAMDPRLQGQLVELTSQIESESEAERSIQILRSPMLQELREQLGPWIEKHGYQGYVVYDTKAQIVASDRNELLGRQPNPTVLNLVKRSIAGETLVVPPVPSVVLLKDDDGVERTGLPTMFAIAPIKSGSGRKIFGAIAIRIRPQGTFSQILKIGSWGQTGETYAFNANGVMISAARDDDLLRRVGILDDRPEARSVLSVEIHDPGVDLTTGARAVVRRRDQPRTVPVAGALQNGEGVDVSGYRNYIGVQSVGAWRWLPELGMGVVTECSYQEAFEPLRALHTAQNVLFGLLAAAVLGFVLVAFFMNRLQQTMRQAALTARQLGQYRLEEKIGSGGMGIVYRGHHSMLRRPTAIKLLHIDRTTDDSIRRFEREVQLTCQLNHPNTIAIYDYGRTPEGIFYYAMEFLDGLNLDRLISQSGPLPAGRCIYIMRQICASLSEAHEIGLVHRDIKPANLVVNRRGGQADFVKVLDFGLVRAVDSNRDTTVTNTNAMAGTPLYMSPEAIQSPSDVDGRTDLYALGAVGYFLFTGTPPFNGTTAMEVCMHQVNTPVTPPSRRLPAAKHAEFESILMRCLAKSVDERFSSARELGEALRNCSAAAEWTERDAEQWWQRYTAITVESHTGNRNPHRAGPLEKTISSDSMIVPAFPATEVAPAMDIHHKRADGSMQQSPDATIIADGSFAAGKTIIEDKPSRLN